MVKQDGYLFIAGPITNFFHESPQFFSSGYDNDFFEYNLKEFNFVKIASDRIGSKRLDFMQNTMKYWPSKKAHDFPLIYSFDDVLFPLRLYLYIKNFLFILIASFRSRKLTNDRKFQTGQIIIFKKI